MLPNLLNYFFWFIFLESLEDSDDFAATVGAIYLIVVGLFVDFEDAFCAKRMAACHSYAMDLRLVQADATLIIIESIGSCLLSLDY